MVLEIQEIKKAYANFSLEIKDLTVRSGEIVGLIGDNGSGKTTTLEAIRFSPEKHIIKYCDKKLKNDDARMGYLKSWGTIYGALKIGDFIQLYQNSFKEWDSDLCSKLLKKYEIEWENTSKTMNSLSTGKLMQLYFVLTISHKPEFLLFDEATSGLDPFIREEINTDLKKYVLNQGAGVIYSSHIISDIEKISTRLLLIRKGKIILDEDIDELRENYIILKREDLKNLPVDSYSIINKFANEVVVKIIDSRESKRFRQSKYDLEDIVFGLYGGTYA